MFTICHIQNLGFTKRREYIRKQPSENTLVRFKMRAEVADGLDLKSLENLKIYNGYETEKNRKVRLFLSCLSLVCLFIYFVTAKIVVTLSHRQRKIEHLFLIFIYKISLFFQQQIYRLYYI